MTTRVWPVDAVADAPSYTGRGLRLSTVSPWLAGATAARPLGGRSGVRPGTSTASVTATSTTWTVKPHVGVVDAQAAAEAGPYAYSTDADVTGSVNAADATNPRIDVVYVRIDDPAEGDGTATPTVAFGYQAGTAAASPVAPTSWTGSARSMVLAHINVPAAGGGSPTVTWKAPTLTAAGGVIPVQTVAERDALAPLGTSFAPVLVYTYAIDSLDRSVGAGFSPVLGRLQHAEYTTTANVVADGVVVNAGSVTVDAAASTDTTFATPGGGTLTINSPGLYAVTWSVVSSSALTGRYFASVKIGATEVAREPGNGGSETTFTLSVPNVRIPTGGSVLTFEVFKNVGGASNVTGRIRITRLGAA
jgi:hypothetical protein